MDYKRKNKVAVVTGGGSGIGSSIAIDLDSLGFNVLISGREKDKIKSIASKGHNIKFIVSDIKKEKDIKDLRNSALDSWGRIDCIVNNAGIFTLSPAKSLNTDDIMEMFKVNVIGPSILIKECVNDLAATSGSIINISSTFGHKASTSASIYSASKAAIDQLTRCFALELAPKGIRVNAIAPGPVETNILKNAGLMQEMIDASNKEMEQVVPLSRRGQPEEIAKWVSHLATNDSWVTGQIISIDGGLSIA